MLSLAYAPVNVKSQGRGPGIPRGFVVLESATSAMQKILSEIKFVNVSTVIRKLHCIVIYIILQQTNFAHREGVFDVSVFFLGTEFDMKIGLKH